MSIPDSDDQRTLQKLEEEKVAIESRSHSGYTDAARFVRIEAEIEAVEERIAREKQHPQYGEG